MKAIDSKLEMLVKEREAEESSFNQGNSHDNSRIPDICGTSDSSHLPGKEIDMLVAQCKMEQETPPIPIPL